MPLLIFYKPFQNKANHKEVHGSLVNENLYSCIGTINY